MNDENKNQENLDRELEFKSIEKTKKRKGGQKKIERRGGIGPKSMRKNRMQIESQREWEESG